MGGAGFGPRLQFSDWPMRSEELGWCEFALEFVSLSWNKDDMGNSL